ncbi:MAG: UDP-N-acetylmuramoyl-L-alanyl-D-glutamate--2,6-diaminopimelate ligase [Actinomycetes bacterium]
MSAEAAASSEPLRPSTVTPTALSALIATVDGIRGAERPGNDILISGITHDSEAVRPGDMFAALPGAHKHGIEFAAAAAERGALAVLTDVESVPTAERSGLAVVSAADPREVLGPLASRVYGTPSEQLLLIGVTGTNGKTTSTYFIEAGLRAAGHTTGLIGTVETRVGDRALPSRHTTPEATDLQALFAVMREDGVDAAAMEVSSHALALRRIDGTSFTVAVFTNLSQDHLDFHRDIEDYYAAKAKLFTSSFTDVAVVNIDDRYGARLAGEAEIRLVTVSPSGRPADWRVGEVDAGTTGSEFVLHADDGTPLRARTQLPGAFNVANAALSIAALVTAGVAPSDAVNGIAACAHVPGRMQRVNAGQPFTAVVDYAHTPEAVKQLIATLRPVTTGRLIVVLGCGGDRDSAKRPLMGAAAVTGSDVAVFTSDNPRSEDPVEIIRAMEAGARGVANAHRAAVHVEPDRRSAIRLAVSLARAGDVVVVAGKGHERVQETGGVRTPFDDVDEVTGAIRATVRAS